MACAERATTLRHIQRLFSEGSFTGLSDTQLLSRFALRRDEAAFAALVARHGPMVLTVCKGLLRDPSDADDAFQATFLVLARKAGETHKKGEPRGWPNAGTDANDPFDQKAAFRDRSSSRHRL